MREEFSAGGIVFKVTPSVIPAQAGIQGDKELDPGSKSGMTIMILLSQHSGHHGWVFPKGFIGDKEEFKGQTKEQTALREVEEETGAIGEIVEPVTPIDYWYEMGEEKRHKTVYYYLMKFVGGDITQHDWEMENVEWLPENKVIERLTYPSDKKVWIEARERLKQILDKPE